MSTYTYFIANTLTGQIIGDLPFKGVSFDWSLSGGGSFSGTLKLSDPDVVEQGALDLEEDGRHAIYVDMDDTLMWAGIIWSLDYDSTSQTMNVGASDYWSWFSRRLANNEIDEAGSRDEDVIDLMLSSALDGGHPANLTTRWDATLPLQGDGVDFLYDPTEYKTVAELVGARVSMTDPNSVDFRLETSWTSPGVAAIVLVLGRPRLGRPLEATGALFDYPGMATKYTRSGTGANVAGRLSVSLSWDSLGDETLTFDEPGTYEDRPRTDLAVSVDIADEDALPARGAYLYKLRQRPTRVYAIETRTDSEPSIFSYKVGDYCRVQINDYLHPNGYTADMRIGSISLTPQGEKVVITPWSDPDA